MAVFATAYNPDIWLRPAERYLPAISPAEKEQIDRYNARIDARLAQITKRLEEWRHGPHQKQNFAAKLARLPEEVRADVEKAVPTPAATRNEIQRYLADKFEAKLKASDQELSMASSKAERSEITRLGNEFGTLSAQRRSFDKIQGLWDIGK